MMIRVCLNYDEQVGKKAKQICRCPCEMSVIFVGL